MHKRTRIIILIIVLCVALIGELYVLVLSGSKNDDRNKESPQTVTEEQSQEKEGSSDMPEEQISDDKAVSYVPDIKRSSSSTKWESDISKIEYRYGEDLPKGKVIFYGSSSIRKWKTLEEDMSGLEVLNHGFGGAKTSDCLYYSDRMIIAFEPAAVVYYAGTNDIGKGRTVEDTYTDTIDFIAYVHHELPETQIYYISQTQQPDRAGRWAEMQELNNRVRDYSLGDRRVTYIDTTKKLNREDGSYRGELFLDDGLHFNSLGYEEWTAVIRPVLYSDLLEEPAAN